MNEPRPDTVERLSRLDQGRFQRLGDILVPQLHADLEGLRAHGVNDADRTVKGTPDSYVGASASACSIAVEYNVWAGRIDEKFKQDYETVRAQCPKAATIVLVASGLVDDLDLKALYAKAAADAVTLRVVGGRQIARHLDEQRQDIRQNFLNIPIRSHGQESLVRHLADAVVATGDGRPWTEDHASMVPRAGLDRAAMGRLAESAPSWTVILGGVGAGKTTWASATAGRLAHGGPVIWAVSKELNFAADDPIGDLVTRVAYGASSPERLIELGDLLRRERLRLAVFLDGLDEAPDYRATGRALRAFKTSAVYHSCHMMLVVRDEAWATLEPTLVDAVPEIGDTKKTARLRIHDLDDREANSWLQRTGATASEARVVLARLPEEFRGRPLFLLRGLRLLRVGHLEAGAPFGPSLVTDFVENISERLAALRPRPSTARVRRALAELAWLCLAAPNESVGVLDLEDHLGGLWADSSDSGPLAQATHAGLLVRFPDQRVAFAHSLFQAAFAADLMADAQPTYWAGQIGRLALATRRARLLSLVPSLPSIEHLADALDGVDDHLAIECAAQHHGAPSPGLAARLLGNLRVLLDSRFRSEVRAAIGLLSRMSGSEPRRFATSWLSGLSAEEQRLWRLESAELFLRLGLPEFFHTILGHHALRRFSDMTWLDPESARTFEALPAGLREHLADRAVEHLTTQEENSAQCEILLCLLRDPRLVDHLSSKARTAGLGRRDHRLLIHLNTPAAQALYVTSAQQWLDQLIALRGEEGKGASEKSQEILHEIVIKQGDIPMFPHDQLSEVVAAALTASTWEIVYVGLEWAETLGDPSLLLPWTEARRALRGFLFGADRTIEATVTRGGVASVQQFLTKTADPLLRRAILEKLALCPGAESESALMAALGWEDVGVAAVRSLGALRVVAAVPGICLLLASNRTDWELSEIVRVLGEIGHESAVAPLVRHLHECQYRFSTAPEGGGAWRDRVWLVCRSLAAIGGEEAVAGLREVLPGCPHEGSILCTVLARADRAGLRFAAERFRAEPSLLAVAAEALGGMDLDRHLPLSRWGGLERVRPHITDASVIALLLPELRRQAGLESRFDFLNNPFRAAGRLDAPESVQWLLEVARSNSAWGEQDDHHRLDASACAKTVLADLGLPEFAAVLIDREVERECSRDSWPFTNRLDEWPRALVRARILLRLQDGTPTRNLTWLFSRFADARDADLLLRLEVADDPEVADIAHRRIRWEGFLSSSPTDGEAA